MLLLISDANILMDVEVGDLVAPMFSLGYPFAVPDVLYYEELEQDQRKTKGARLIYSGKFSLICPGDAVLSRSGSTRGLPRGRASRRCPVICSIFA